MDTKYINLHYCSNNRDIPKSKQAEELIRESDELYRSILNASQDTIMITDPKGFLLMVSNSAITMFGYKVEEEILGRSITDFLISKDQEGVLSFNSFIIEILGPSEYRGVCCDGNLFAVEMNSRFVKNAEGTPVKIVFNIRDISKHKQADEEIHKWVSIFKHTQWGIVALCVKNYSNSRSL
jgi:PAS domain S-box-containing protein